MSCFGKNGAREYNIMLKKLTAHLFPIIVLLWGCAAEPPADTGGISITAVQFAIREEFYTSPAVFEARLRTICRDAMEDHRPDLIVFPEYTGALLGITEYSDIFTSVSTIDGAFREIRRTDQEITSLFTLFLENAGQVSRRMDRIFGGLAEEFDVYILGGTYFHASEESSGTINLYNRLVLYDPRGERRYEQDKVFLTPFERDLLKLSPGEFPADPGIEIQGVPVVFTICRDAFFDEWTEINEDGYIWIDIKANGDVFDEEAKELFRRALPERLSEGDVPYGLTVSLTGRFLDLFWEGQTSAYTVVNGVVFRTAYTKKRYGKELLHITFPAPGD